MGIDVEKYLGWRRHDRSNADRIRAMTDEELAKWFLVIQDDNCCMPDLDDCPIGKDCIDCWLDWLKQEVEE